MEPDEDPDVAVAVLEGRARGSKEYARICLADAIAHGDYPKAAQPMIVEPDSATLDA